MAFKLPKKALLCTLLSSAIATFPINVAASLEREPQSMAYEEYRDDTKKSLSKEESMPYAQQNEIGHGQAKENVKTDEAEINEKYKNSLSVNTNFSDFSIGGRTYQRGLSLNAHGDVGFKLSSRLALNSKLDIGYKIYDAVNEDSSENLTSLSLYAGLRGKVFASGMLNAYIGFGAEYLLDNENMTFAGKKAYVTKAGIGPALSLVFDSEHLNVSVYASKISIKQSSSYGKDAHTWTGHASAIITPRVWKLEMPISCDFFAGPVVNYDGKYDGMIKFALRPGIEIAPSISLFGEMSYANSFVGEEEYVIKELGMGVRTRW